VDGHNPGNERRETTELEPEPIFDARSMTREQLQAAIAELLEKHPGVAALVPCRAVCVTP
jgi:hypothetical protein